MLWLAGGDGTLGPQRPGLSPVPSPGLRQAVRRTQRRGAEPELPASDIIAFVVFCRLRYRLTLRVLSEILLLRGFTVSHETIRKWGAKLLPVMGDALRKRRHGTGRRSGRSWLVDETYLKVQGCWCHLYRAVDRDGNIVDTVLSKSRNMAAAQAFFRSAKATTGFAPDRVTTDGHGSYLRAVW